jgi:hypothetical protein
LHLSSGTPDSPPRSLASRIPTALSRFRS